MREKKGGFPGAVKEVESLFSGLVLDQKVLIMFDEAFTFKI